MLIKLNPEYIKKNLSRLITITDYVPINFQEYNAQETRNTYLQSQNLLATIQEMAQTIQEKCKYYEDHDKAKNSVIIEWIECHPEHKAIISNESVNEYQRLKNNNDYMDFVDLLYDVELPSEKKEYNPDFSHLENKDFIIKDDSSTQLPDFNKKRKFYEDYPSSLLASYLSYLV